MNDKRQIQFSPNNDLQNADLKGLYVKDVVSFIKDNNFSYFYKKTERLVSAVYLLTSLFDDREPIKDTLRKNSLELLDLSLVSKFTIAKFGKKSWLDQWENQLLKVDSFLETSFFAGLISQMNLDILKKEIEKMAGLANSYLERCDLGGKNGLSNNFFFVQNHGLIGQFEKDNVGQTDERNKLNYDKGHNGASNQEIKINHVGQGKDKDEKFGKERKNKRQIKILDIIKDKKSASIKDISDNIKDCSEKTIQRELIFMVKSGILKKEGERRWSRYSLNL